MDETVVDVDTARGTPAGEDRTDEYTEDELLVEEVSIDGMCGVY